MKIILLSVLSLAIGLPFLHLGPIARPPLPAPPPPPPATYYLDPAGSDANPGTQASPWLTVNHVLLNCGDTIVANPGNYSQMTVTTSPNCYGATHGAVWTMCATFDTCKLNLPTGNTQGGILVEASNWAFVGWEVHTGLIGESPYGNGFAYGACFNAIPPGSNSSASIHDIYFFNDIANGCVAGGFSANANGSAGVDYFVVGAVISYNAAQGFTECYSGLNHYQPKNWDTAAGTHIFFVQIFTYHNVEPDHCAGPLTGSPNSTDGEGVIFDTFNGAQSNGALPPYTGQAAAIDVWAGYNGAMGILAGGGSGNSSAPMYVRNATAFSNFRATSQNQYQCGEIVNVGFPPDQPGNANNLTHIFQNLAIPGGPTDPDCGNNPTFGYYFGNVNATDTFHHNAGSNYGFEASTVGFVIGPGNVFGLTPSIFPNPVEPPAPNCSGKANVIDCMSTVIANFTPIPAALKTYGYQPPSSTPRYDPLFPQWLCGQPIPAGLITMGCKSGGGVVLH